MSNGKMTAKVSEIGEFYLYTLNSKNDVQFKKPKVMNILLVDNSASMGKYTRQVISTIGQGLFNYPEDKVDMEPGIIFTFSRDVNLISDKVSKDTNFDRLNLPRQHNTNITKGIKYTIGYIYRNSNPDIHYILTFMSDGEHNCGPELSNNDISYMRKKLDEKNIRLSIIVVGVMDSQTKLGMKIKTGLETVVLTELDSVYYANNFSDMDRILIKLQHGCVSSLSSGATVELSLRNGEFVENTKSELRSFVSDQTNIVLVKGSKDTQPELLINKTKVVPTNQDLNPKDVSAVVSNLTTIFSQKKIANGTEYIKEHVIALQSFIETVDTFFRKLASSKELKYSPKDIGKTHITPEQRIKIIKTVRRTQNKFQEEKNKIKQLLTSISNDSAKQAAYLTGINKKYSGKAVIRSGKMDVSYKDVLTEMKKLRDKLKTALENDRNPDIQGNLDTSILSMNNCYEQLEEWLETIDNLEELEFTDIYSLLVCFGFPAYSVKFDHNNAVQMDPFQTYCKDIELCPIDTSCLMLANQVNHKVESLSREKITDGLILVDPATPETSRVAMRSKIYEYLCSIVMCRDLYMYNPRMTFSMHAHSLLKSIDKFFDAKSSSYVNLATRIIYSMRKYWGQKRCITGDNVNLFKHWLKDCGTLTQSEKDNCSHPVQLILMLSSFDLKELGLDKLDYTKPLINLFNEVLARSLKIKLKGILKDNTDTRALAIKLSQDLFGITKENSPKTNPDHMVEEPSQEIVRESCITDADYNPNTDVYCKLQIKDIPTFIENCLTPYLRAFHFGISIQNYITTKNTSWKELIINFEKYGCITTDLIEFLTDKLKSIESIKLMDYLKINPEDREQVTKTMFLQAFLNHTSKSRENINSKSVKSLVTLQEYIKDLRMAHYADGCEEKNKIWLSMVGDVIFEKAYKADLESFKTMIGSHTHKHKKEIFWALLNAAKLNKEKAKYFVSMSSTTVLKHFDKSILG